jgi:hypothetical protein
MGADRRSLTRSLVISWRLQTGLFLSLPPAILANMRSVRVVVAPPGRLGEGPVSVLGHRSQLSLQEKALCLLMRISER